MDESENVLEEVAEEGQCKRKLVFPTDEEGGVKKLEFFWKDIDLRTIHEYIGTDLKGENIGEQQALKGL